ncbi:MAG: HNH endonuclease signature motif containing protein [Phormidesmis sp.]
MSRQYIPVEQQREIIQRSNRRCEYCKSHMDYSPQSFAIEHVMPVARGGKTEIDNLAFACGGCNGHKYTKTEAVDDLSRSGVPLYNPRKQSWYDHFVWSPDLSKIVGITAIGRATVIALKVNRIGNANLRQLLLLIGRHPPT